MNRFGMALSVVAFGSVALAAQSPAPTPTQAAVPGQGRSFGQIGNLGVKDGSNAGQAAPGTSSVYVLPVPSSPDCPVSMHAQQQGGLGILTAQDDRGESRRRSGVAQHIRLILGEAGNSTQIVSAKVTVRGTSPKGRMTPTVLSQDVPPDAKKTQVLTFKADWNEGVSANLTLPGFTSVTSISLDSLTYADGSTWRPSNGRGCRTAPDLMMLVDAR
jgi:hypothetical protein